MSEQKFNFGDLVRVSGYDDRIFSVDGWRVEQHYYPDEKWTDVVYDLTDVHNAEWLEAVVDDLELVEKAEKAAEYKPKEKGGEIPMSILDFSGGGRQVRVAPEIERHNKARERERKVNKLLDERNDMRILHEMFGDDQYKKRIEEIDKELRSVE